MLDQGISGLEFKRVVDSSTDCAAETYSSATGCSIQATFTPKYPGERLGAVEVLDGSSNILATAYIQGTGTGPQIAFATTNSQGDYIPSSQISLTPPSGGFVNPTGVAVDGAGNAFIAQGAYGVSEIVAVNGSIPATPTINSLGMGHINAGRFYYPVGVAVDGSGNVFVADEGTADGSSQAVYEIEAVNGSVSSSSTLRTLGSGLAGGAVAVAGNGNVFVASGAKATVYELDYADAAALSYTTPTVVGATDTIDGTKSLLVQNIGNEALTISGLVGPTDFAHVDGSGTPPDCAATGTVAEDASCNLSIEFAPSQTATPGLLSESFTLADNNLNATTQQSIMLSGTATAPITFTSPSSETLDAGTVGTPYSQAFTASGGTSPYTYTSSSESLPAGLILSSAGVLSGTPTTAGSSYSFIVTATDKYANTGSQTYTLVISKATPTVSASAWPTASAITYGQTLASSTLSGGTGSVPGSFAFTTPATAPGVGTAAQSVTFTPTDSTDYSSVTGTVSVTVNKATATVTLGSLSQTYTGSPLVATAITNPVGLTVNFTYNGSSTAPTTAGSYAVIAAIYDTNYSGSVTGAMVILQATSAAGVTSNSNPVLLQNAATFTATVSSKAGTVTFLDGTTPLGTGTLSGGLATLTTSALTAGTHSISAAYGGDTNFAAASSGALTQTVLDFSLTAGSGSGSTTQTAFPGGTATYALAILPSGSTILPVPVTLTISGMPTGATATITPSSWTQLTSTSWSFPANTPLTDISLSIQLPSTMSSLNQKEMPSRKLPFAFLSILLLPFAGKMRRTGRKLSRMLSILLLLIAGMTAMVGLSGCGSATGFFAQAQKSYTVTATATSGTLSHSTTMTLTVE